MRKFKNKTHTKLTLDALCQTEVCIDELAVVDEYIQLVLDTDHVYQGLVLDIEANCFLKKK